jgi:hypothetical protein
MKPVRDSKGLSFIPSGAPKRRQAGILLGECLVYISVWSVLLGLSFAAYYRVLDNTTRLRRSAADITRVLQAGERWREDVRQANGPLKLVGIEGTSDHAFHIPQLSGEVVYYFTGTNVLRRADAAAPWNEALARVKASRVSKDTREQVVAWRLEVELDAGKKKTSVRPLFTFQAVAPVQEKP